MKFKLVYTDNPWQYNQRSNDKTKFGLGMNVYKGLHIYDLIDIYTNHLEPLLDDNCMIASWAIGPKMDQYFQIVDAMKAKGFRHITQLFTWVKLSKSGTERKLPGFYTLSNTESLMLCGRGSLPIQTRGIGQVFNTYYDAEVFYEECLKPHSAKPPETRKKLVDIFGEVSKIELFARANKILDDEQWYNCGDEVKEMSGMDIRDGLKLISERINNE